MTVFTDWLKEKNKNNELQITHVSEDDELDKLYWHKVLEISGLNFPDGIYFITACLKEGDEYVFGLYPLEVSGENIWITYRSKDLDWLKNTKIIENKKYNKAISKIVSGFDKIAKESN